MKQDKLNTEELVELFDALPTGIAVQLNEGTFEYANKTLLDLLGYSLFEFKSIKEQVLFEKHENALQKDSSSRSKLIESQRKVIKSKKNKAFTVFEKRQEIKWQGKDAVMIAFSDFTSLPNLNNVFSQSYKAIIEMAEDIMFTCDFKGVFLYANKFASDILGYQENELLGMKYIDLVAPFDKERVINYYQTMFNERLDHSNFEFAVTTKKGQTLWLHQKMSTIWDEVNKRIVGYTSVCRDVTERVQAVNKLRKTEEQGSAILSALQQLIFTIDPIAFQIIDCNDFAAKKLGYSISEIKNKLISDFEHEVVKSHIGSELNKNPNAVSSFESFWINSKGNVFNAAVDLSPIEIAEKKMILVSVLDVSEQKKLQYENERFQAAMQEAPFGIYVVELDSGKIIDVNNTKAKRLGYTKKELLALNIRDIDDNEILRDRNRRIKYFLKMKKSENFTVESKHIRKDGSRFPVRMVASIKEIDGAFHLIASVQDITKELEKEIQLIEQNQVLGIIKQLQQDFIIKEDLSKQFNSFLDSLVIFTKSQFGFMGEILHNENGNPFLKTHSISSYKRGDDIKTIFGQNNSENIDFTDLNDLLGGCLISGEHVVSNNLKEDKRFSKMRDEYPEIDSFIGVPVKINDKLIGVIGLVNKKRGFTYKEIEGLEPFVSTYAVMIQAIRNDREKTKTERDLKDKETLLKEIHHRVKNNMQVISSMLTLTFSKFDDSVKAALEDSNARINTVALVHEQLYDTKNLKELKSAQFIRSLLEYIRTIYSNNQLVNLDFDIEDFPLDIDKAIPMGLIINEIVSNSYKYAFNNHSDPQIKISFKKDNDQIVMELSDNGETAIELETILESKSLGLKLVKSLSKQLRSELRIDNKQGLKYSFTWKY